MLVPITLLLIVATAAVVVGLRYMAMQDRIFKLETERARVAELARMLVEVDRQYERVRALLGDSVPPFLPRELSSFGVAETLKIHEQQIHMLEEDVEAVLASLALESGQPMTLAALRRDVDDLRDRHQMDVQTLGREIDRMTDIVIWFLGFLVAICVAIFGWFVSGFRRDSHQPPTMQVDKPLQ